MTTNLSFVKFKAVKYHDHKQTGSLKKNLACAYKYWKASMFDCCSIALDFI